jgi:hypothetical protein
MSATCMRNMRRKLSFRYKILVGAFAFSVLAGMGTVGYARVSGRNSRAVPPRQMRIFNPFTLKSTIMTSWKNSGSGSVHSSRFVFDRGLQGHSRIHRYHHHRIRIPYRPVCRSPFRPPLTLSGQQL